MVVNIEIQSPNQIIINSSFFAFLLISLTSLNFSDSTEANDEQKEAWNKQEEWRERRWKDLWEIPHIQMYLE